MSDKPDKSMRPDDHRRKWDSVEYEKNAQARLELEEAIEKSRERKDRLEIEFCISQSLPVLWVVSGCFLNEYGSCLTGQLSGGSLGRKGTN